MRAVTARAMVAAAALGFTTAYAAAPSPSPSQRDQTPFEATPFIGFALGGSFTLTNTGQSVEVGDHGSFALALDVEADGLSQYELFYSRQSTTLRESSTFPPMGISVQYLHLGGTALLDEAPRVKSYILGGLGVTRFSPPAPGLVDTRFSLSLGLGLRIPVNERLSLRLEARGFATLVSSNAAIFCRSDQTGLLCQIHGHGSTFLQGEALAGVAFAF